jgi:hypothetical protein
MPTTLARHFNYATKIAIFLACQKHNQPHDSLVQQLPENAYHTIDECEQEKSYDE